MEERSHAEVACIDEDGAERVNGAFTVNRRCQAGVPAAFRPGAIGHENALREKTRVEVVGKQDSHCRGERTGISTHSRSEETAIPEKDDGELFHGVQGSSI